MTRFSALIYAFSLMLSLALFSLPLHAGNSVGNGGDLESAEFVQTARLALDSLQQIELEPGPKAMVTKMRDLLDQVRVQSEWDLKLNGRDVSAINYPAELLIVIDPSDWGFAKGERIELRLIFVLHEYLGVAGFDDSKYEHSEKLASHLRADFLNDFSAKEMLRDSLVQISGTFWFYLNRSEPNQTNDVCISSGELTAEFRRVQTAAQAHPHWFRKWDATQKTLARLQTTIEEFQSICRRSEESILEQNLDRELTAVSTKGHSIESDLSTLLYY